MITIDVNVASGDWPKIEALELLTNAAINLTIEQTELMLPDSSEVSFVFANDDHVQKLNNEWRGQDKPTNVLSFSANDGVPPNRWSPLLGDVVLAVETVAREAKEQDKSFDHHLTHLVVHGFLHLVGFDHIDDGDAETMEATETRILAQLGIADPYTSQ